MPGTAFSMQYSPVDENIGDYCMLNVIPTTGWIIQKHYRTKSMMHVSGATDDLYQKTMCKGNGGKLYLSYLKLE